MPYVKARGAERRRLPETPTRRHPQPTGPDDATVLRVLKRADGRCEVHGEDIIGGRGWDWSIHHRRGRSGIHTDNTVANLLLVCGRDNITGCHGRIHQSGKTWAQPLGYSISRHGYADPTQVPVRLHGEQWVLFTADGGYQATEGARDG